MRITGLASGMDTDSMVKELMTAESVKLNRYNQQKQVNVWQQEMYNDINKEISNFIIDTRKEFGLGYGGSLGSATWMKKVTSSNEDVMSATAMSGAANGTHRIKVKQIAEGVSMGSNADVKDEEIGVAGTLTFTYNDKDGTSKTMDIAYTNTDKPSDIAAKINEQSETLGLNASYDANAKRFFISTKDTGAKSQINITDSNSSGALNKLHLLEPTYPMGTSINKKGKDAIIDFDGASNIHYSSNNFVISGMSIDLKGMPADPTKEITLKVDNDTDACVEKITNFVDSYNKLIDDIEGTISQTRYRDYPPLTDDQKKEMSEDDIKLWNEKAKSGLLRNDEYIERMLQTTRSGMYEKVEGIEGPFDSLFEIGITTGNYKDKGKLVIDEEKLRSALDEDTDGVMNLLFSTSDVSETDAEKDPALAKKRRSETGVFNRMYDDLTVGMQDIINKAGPGDNSALYRNVKSNIMVDYVTKGSKSLIGNDIITLDKQIADEKVRLAEKENSYYAKFGAMEQAMNKMNSQMSWLQSQM